MNGIKLVIFSSLTIFRRRPSRDCFLSAVRLRFRPGSMLCEEQVLARKSLRIQTYHQSVLSHPRSLKTLTRFTRLGVKTVSCYTMRRSSSSRGVADGIGKLVNSELDTEALMQLAGEEWDRQQAEKKSASRR